MQRVAGNRATCQLVARTRSGAEPEFLSVQRNGFRPSADGAGTPTAERIDRVDGFLADRVSLFTVRVWGDRYVALLDRTKNTWSERYTPQALTAAGITAVIRDMTEAPPPVDAIDAMRDELLRDRRYRIEAPATLGPAAVDPMYVSRVDRDAVGTLIVRLGLKLSERGRSLEAESGLGAFFSQRLVEVAQNFGSVRRHLETNAALREADLTSDHVFTMLTEPTPRSSAAELAKSHNTTRILGGARDLNWTALSPEQWAGVLADIAVVIVQAAGRAALERQERQRRHELNERLRPHRLSVGDSAEYILQTFDPESSVMVNFLGPVKVEGGQVIVNAAGQELFILRAGSQVIYQNLSDRHFYVQSAQGIQQELVYGVFALTAEKTKHIIPVTRFMMDVTAAIFPPVRLPYLAMNVLNVANHVMTNMDELLRLAENIQISCRAIDELLPGLLGKAIRGTVSSGLTELFSPKVTRANPQYVLLLFLRIASAVVRGGAAGQAAGQAVKAAWAEVRRELRSLGGIWAQVKVLVVRQLDDPESVDEQAVQQLVPQLARLVGEGENYARLLMRMDAAQIERLIYETEELGTTGSDLADLIMRSFAW